MNDSPIIAIGIHKHFLPTGPESVSACHTIASAAEERELRSREGVQGSQCAGPGWQAVSSRVAPRHQVGLFGILSRTAILVAGPCLTFVWQFIHFLKHLFFFLVLGDHS